MKTEQFKEIFKRSFSDPQEWREWFFSNIVNDENQIYTEADRSGKAASALLMQPYKMLYHDSEIDTAYISCVATLPENRSQGLASKLIRKALADARDKGFCMCEIIPAEDHLYYFYSRLDFETVFYTDRERYTSLHSFHPGRGELVEPSYSLFHELEKENGCCILHTEDEYENILSDLKLDGGDTVLAATDEEGHSALLLACADGDDAVKVKSLMGQSKYAVRTVLCELRRLIGEKSITVYRPPLSGDKALLHPYGMARIVNPLIMLRALASAHPQLNLTIRLRDQLLQDNTGIYTISRGECTYRPWSDGKFDLDIAVDTLAGVLFSSHATGEIFDIPARRPYMTLMLD